MTRETFNSLKVGDKIKVISLNKLNSASVFRNMMNKKMLDLCGQEVQVSRIENIFYQGTEAVRMVAVNNTDDLWACFMFEDID